MFKSIRTKNMFFLISLAVSLLIIISYLLVVGVEGIARDMAQQNLKDRALALSVIITEHSKERGQPKEGATFYTEAVDRWIPGTMQEESFLINQEKQTLFYFDEEIPYDLNFSKEVICQKVYKNGETYLTALAPIKGVPELEGWFIGTEKKFSDVFRRINNLKTAIIVLVIFILFILWPLAKRISYAVAKPIQDLSKAAAQIAAGDISQEISVKDKDELADIADSFNLMLNNLKFTMQQVLVKSGEAESMQEITEYVEKNYDNLPTGVVGINVIGEVTIFNKAAEQITGIYQEAVVGLSIANPMPKEIKPLIDALKRCMSRGSIQLKSLTEIYNTEGLRVPIVHSVHIQFGLKKEVIGTICIFKRIEDIEKFEESAARAKNLEFLGEMAASLAHEIKNPLTSVRGYTQLVKFELEEKQIELAELDVIVYETDRLTQMLDRFLKFARPAIPQMQRMDVRPLLTYVIRLVEKDCPENIVIKTRFNEVPAIFGDEELLEQVFLNLLFNAIQAMPEGGIIEVRVLYSEKRKLVSIEVQDSGRGIPREISEKIFQPFFTTKENGAGMGLAICSRIVEAHKGLLEVESVVGEMTLFTLLLQAAKPF